MGFNILCVGRNLVLRKKTDDVRKNWFHDPKYDNMEPNQGIKMNKEHFTDILRKYMCYLPGVSHLIDRIGEKLPDATSRVQRR